MSRGAKQNTGEENRYRVPTLGSRQESLNWQAGSLAPPVRKCCLIKNMNVSSGPLRGTQHVKLHAILLSISQGVFLPHSFPLTASRSAGSEQPIEKQQLGRASAYALCAHGHMHTFTHNVSLYKWAETAGTRIGREVT